MKRWLLVCVRDLPYPYPAPRAVADALAAAGINADVSVARTSPPVLKYPQSRPFDLAFEVRPPEPKPEGFVVTAV